MKKILSEEFWIPILEKLSIWFLTELPSIIITIIVFIIALKFFKKLSEQIQPFLMKRKYVERSLNSHEAEKRIITLVNISKNTIRVSLWIVFSLILLSKLGIEIAPLLAGAGIVGLAVGFGSQELVRDVISGFFMLIENQIRVNDVATINSTTGTVEKIELRTTTLRDTTGTVHIFQNGKISTLSNLTKDWSATILEIGIAYKENVADVMLLMRQAFDELKNDLKFSEIIIDDFEIMGLDRFDSSSVVIKTRIKTLPGDQWRIKREYQNILKTLFDKENIEIPFPHTTIYWGEKTPSLKIAMDKN